MKGKGEREELQYFKVLESYQLELHSMAMQITFVNKFVSMSKDEHARVYSKDREN